MYNCLYPRRIVVFPVGSRKNKDGSPGRRVVLSGDPDLFDIVPSVYNRDSGEATDISVIPCGKCINCRRNRSLLWSRRLLMESACYDFYDQIFLTLTYDDQHVPPDHNYEDFQSFMRSLRKSLSADGLPSPRYFVTAEKGDLFGRPHYHVLLFGYRPWDEKGCDSVPYHPELWHCPRIDKAWNKGFSEFAPVSPADINYVSHYAQKKQIDGSDSFSRMSLKPGIGYNFIRDHLDTIFRDEGFYLGGKFYRLDRYALKVLVRDFGLSLSAAERIKSDKIALAEKFFDQYNSTLPQRINDRRLADAYLRRRRCQR